MLLTMRDERSLLMLLGLKYLLTDMVTSMVAALAQGSDPNHTEACCCLLQALASVWSAIALIAKRSHSVSLNSEEQDSDIGAFYKRKAMRTHV